MNMKRHRNNFFCGALIFTALAGGFFLVSGLRAPANGSRRCKAAFCWSFDTSSDNEVARRRRCRRRWNTLMATSMGGQLHAGRQHRPCGRSTRNCSAGTKWGYALTKLESRQRGVMIASDILKAVRNQHYGNSTRFGAVAAVAEPRSWQNSERLTVLIFCDGGAQIQRDAV
jgi:hypothetical protein